MKRNTSQELTVDMLRCDAYGHCAEFLPSTIQLDEWGYPIVSADISQVPASDLKRVVAACPKLALRLNTVRDAGAPVGGTTRSREDANTSPAQVWSNRGLASS